MNASRNALTDHLDVKACVRFRIIPRAFVVLANVLLAAERKFHAPMLITGAAYEEYTIGGIHDSGYAWDIRAWEWKDPVTVVRWIDNRLQAVDHRYRTVYGDKDHLDHVHVEYRHYMAEG